MEYLSYILDVIVLVIVLIFAMNGRKQGFVRSIGGLAVIIAAVVISTNLSTSVGAAMNEKFVHAKVETAIAKLVSSDAPDMAVTEESAAEIQEGLPAGLKLIADLFHVDIDATIEEFEGTMSELKATITDSIADVASRALAFVLLLIASFILLKIVLLLLDRVVSHLPLFHTANSLVGLIVGALKGIVWAWVFCAVSSFLWGFLTGSIEALGAIDVEKTLIYYRLAGVNPLTWLF